MMERVFSARYDRIARLPGHDFRFHKHGRDGSGKADACATGLPDHAVWGTLVELDAGELATLDRYEPGYDRSVLEVEVPEGGNRRQAHVYVARPAVVDPAMVPFVWYREMVVTGGAARGLPDEYVARIAAMPARTDPKPLSHRGRGGSGVEEYGKRPPAMCRVDVD
jgi:hypothetical protein